MENYRIEDMSDIVKLLNINENIYSVTIELCTICNWKCEHCYLPVHDNYGMSKEKIFSMLQELREMGCYEIVFTGGEIFSRSDALEIIEKAREMHFEVILMTNISLLTEEAIETLSKVYVSLISCTVFSMNNEIHDSITCTKGSLKRVMKNLELIKKYKIPFEIKTVVMKKNVDEFPKVERFCNKNNFKFTADSDIIAKSNGDKESFALSVPNEQKKGILKYLDRLGGYEPQKKEDNRYVCNSTRHSMYIKANGEIWPCYKLALNCGSVKDEKLIDVWKKSKKLNLIRNIQWKDIEGCSKCGVKDYCVRCIGAADNIEEYLYSKIKTACDYAYLRKEVYTKK